MTDQSMTARTQDNSPEYVAMKMTEIVLIYIENGSWNRISRETYLDTYAECLAAVRGQRTTASTTDLLPWARVSDDPVMGEDEAMDVAEQLAEEELVAAKATAAPQPEPEPEPAPQPDPEPEPAPEPEPEPAPEPVPAPAAAAPAPVDPAPEPAPVQAAEPAPEPEPEPEPAPVQQAAADPVPAQQQAAPEPRQAEVDQAQQVPWPHETGAPSGALDPNAGARAQEVIRARLKEAARKAAEEAAQSEDAKIQKELAAARM